MNLTNLTSIFSLNNRSSSSPLVTPNLCDSNTLDSVTDDADICCICLDNFKLPLLLSCQHKFCYLCIKAVYHLTAKCPLCRNNINNDSIEKVSLTSSFKLPDITWIYSSRDNNWWLYESSIANEIEIAYQQYLKDITNKKVTSISIMDKTYQINFEQMIQYYQNCKRKIKRLVNTNNNDKLFIKGIAGIKMEIRDAEN